MNAPDVIGIPELMEVGRRITAIFAVAGVDPSSPAAGAQCRSWLQTQRFDPDALLGAMLQVEHGYLRAGVAGTGSCTTHAFIAGWLARELYGFDGGGSE